MPPLPPCVTGEHDENNPTDQDTRVHDKDDHPANGIIVELCDTDDHVDENAVHDGDDNYIVEPCDFRVVGPCLSTHRNARAAEWLEDHKRSKGCPK